jgi:hypothetical protein
VAHRCSSNNIALPQGPSLRSGLCCPGPSTLNRPHLSHSRARRNFPAVPVICDAFAVRERLGDPRVVPHFRCSFLSTMSSPMTPASSSAAFAQFFADDNGLAPTSDRLDARDSPAIRFRRALHFGAYTVHYCYNLVDCLLLWRIRPDYEPQELLRPGFRQTKSPWSTAGYDYDDGWAISSAGLSPAGMAASVAAPEARRVS